MTEIKQSRKEDEWRQSHWHNNISLESPEPLSFEEILEEARNMGQYRFLLTLGSRGWLGNGTYLVRLTDAERQRVIERMAELGYIASPGAHKRIVSEIWQDAIAAESSPCHVIAAKQMTDIGAVFLLENATGQRRAVNALSWNTINDHYGDRGRVMPSEYSTPILWMKGTKRLALLMGMREGNAKGRIYSYKNAAKKWSPGLLTDEPDSILAESIEAAKESDDIRGD